MRFVPFAFLLLQMFCNVQDVSADSLASILQHTERETIIRAEKLEKFARSEPSSKEALSALIIAARTRMEIQEDDPKNTDLDYQEVMKSAMDGSWEKLLATTGLISAYHLNGLHEEVIRHSEKILQTRPGLQLKKLANDIPKLVRDELKLNFPDDGSSTLDDDIRSILALAYKRKGNDKEALRVFSEISDARIKNIISGEINRDLPNGISVIPDPKPSLPVAQKNEAQPNEEPTFHQPQQREEPKVLSPVVSANASPKHDIWTWFPWVLSVTLALGWVMWSLVRKNK
jgi:hypothetical protein